MNPRMQHPFSLKVTRLKLFLLLLWALYLEDQLMILLSTKTWRTGPSDLRIPQIGFIYLDTDLNGYFPYYFLDATYESSGGPRQGWYSKRNIRLQELKQTKLSTRTKHSLSPKELLVTLPSPLRVRFRQTIKSFSFPREVSKFC